MSESDPYANRRKNIESKSANREEQSPNPMNLNPDLPSDQSRSFEDSIKKGSSDKKKSEPVREDA